MQSKATVRVLLTGTAATSLMTLFSYAASRLKNENYKEAELLALLIKPFLKEHKALSRPLGWMGHISLGLGWAAINDALFTALHLKRNIYNGTYSGILSGLTGVIIWKSLFKANPKPPRINHQAFYTQLAMAHVVFMLAFVTISRSKAPAKALAGRLPIA